MLSAEVPENLRIRTEVLSGGGRPVKRNAALAAISEVVLLRLIWPADGVTLGAAAQCCCFAVNQTFPRQGFMEYRKQTGPAAGGGGRPPTSKLCKIRTLAIYNPGSHREAVPLWPFSGQVAAEVSQSTYRWPSLYFHRVQEELGMGRGSCYHTSWLLYSLIF